MAGSLNNLGAVSQEQGDLPAARNYYQQALVIIERLAPSSLDLAGSLNNLGAVTHEQGDLPAAQDYFQRALTIREKLAPNSLDMASSLNNLGVVALARGDLTAARTFYQRALVMEERLAPGSLAVANSLNNLGVVSQEQGNLPVAHDYFQRALTTKRKLAPGSLEVAASLNNLGGVARDQGDLPAARGYCQQALAIQQKLASGSLVVAGSLNNLGVIAQEQGDLVSARTFHQRALMIQEKLAAGSLAVASTLGNLGAVTHEQGDLPVARDYYRRALTIQEKLAPGSLAVAITLNNLGVAIRAQGDLTTAREYQQQALAIREKLAPDSLAVASSLDNLGAVARELGDLTAARGFHQRALMIEERLAPGSLAMAGSLSNLGVVAHEQGELNVARDYYQRALAIAEKMAPDSLQMAASLNDLGTVFYSQGDLPAAGDYYRSALVIMEKLAPGSLAAANSLNNLGTVAHDQGDLSGALVFYQRAQVIREKLAPGSLAAAASLNNLGSVTADRGGMATARDYYRRALVITEKLAPGSLLVAGSLYNLGSAADHQGDLTTACDYYRRALAITDKLAHGSLEMALCLSGLGKVASAQGDLPRAEALALRAWQIVQHQGVLISGDEARWAFHNETARYATRLCTYRFAQGKLGLALAALEAGRAQALLQLLADRHLFDRRIDPQLWKYYQDALRLQNQATKALEQTGLVLERGKGDVEALETRQAGDDAVAEARARVERAQRDWDQKRQTYDRARVDAEEQWRRILAALPREARPLVPETFHVDAAQRDLLPGTLFAEFSISDGCILLFLLPWEGRLKAYRLQITPQKLAADVAFVRESVAGDEHGRAVRPVGATVRRIQAAHELFQALFPAEARAAIAAARSLAISPDGVLWDLPFAALITDRSDSQATYLGLQKPLTYVQSLALYRRVITAPLPRTSGPPIALVAGNPLCNENRRPEVLRQLRQGPRRSALRPANANPHRLAVAGVSLPSRRRTLPIPKRYLEQRLLTRDGEIPEDLEYAGWEAEEIAALYGTRAPSQLECTEAWFRGRAGKADVIHLATHGYFRSFHPMSSGVWLAVPGMSVRSGQTDNDAALQAWELMSDPKLSLRAELVVLSACETAAGVKIRSEGLVGLTRAFQVAGAQSVVASQWKVDDPSTAELMVAFHRQLRGGVAKDEALRRAMNSVFRLRQRWENPFHWAGFLLMGDPRNHHLRRR